MTYDAFNFKKKAIKGVISWKQSKRISGMMKNTRKCIKKLILVVFYTSTMCNKNFKKSFAWSFVLEYQFKTIQQNWEQKSTHRILFQPRWLQWFPSWSSSEEKSQVMLRHEKKPKNSQKKSFLKERKPLF